MEQAVRLNLPVYWIAERIPATLELSLVAANYGLPQRNLGTVSVIGASPSKGLST